MPTAGDFSLHVIGQAQGFEQMSSQVNQFAGSLDTAGSSATRFASSTNSLGSGFSSIATGTDQMTAGFTRSADALGNFGQSTSTFSSQINTMGTSFNTAGQSVAQFGGSLEQGQAGIGQFTTGVEQMNQAVGQSATPLGQLGDGMQTLQSDLTGVGQGIAGVDQNLNGLAQGGLTEANTVSKDLGQTFEMNTGIFKNFDNTQKSTFETMKSGFGDAQQLASGFAQASGSITGLIFSAYALEKAQFAVHRTETTLEAARLRLDKMTSKLADTTAKYGKDSTEVAQAEEAIAVQTQRNADLTERYGLIQENYTRQLTVFATTTGPLVISTISGVAQGITSMGQVLNVNRGQVASFIAAWGPAIAIGAIAAGIAASVIKMYADMAQADADYKAALERNDTAGMLKAQFQKVQDVINSPMAQLGYATPAGAAHKAEDIAALEKQYGAEGISKRIPLGNQLQEFIASEEFGNLKEVSPEIRSQVEGLLARMKLFISEERKKVNFGLDTETPEEMAARQKNTETAFNTTEAQIKALLTKGMAEREQIFMHPTSTAQTAMMLGVPDNATLTESMSRYKAYQNEVNVAAVNFRNAQKMGYQGSVDDYATEFLGGMDEQGKKMLHDKIAADDDLIKTTKEDQKKLQEATLKAMLDTEIAKAKVKHDAIEATNKANEEQLKSDLQFQKQQAEIESQNIVAWKQRTGMITEEQKLVADMNHEKKNTADTEKTLTKQYEQEAMQLTGLNNLNGLRVDQIAELALTQEKHTKIIRDANVELMHMADAAGIDASRWIQLKAAETDSIDTVQELNDNLEILINTSTDFLQMILAPTQEQLNAVNMAYTKGVVSVKSYIEQQFLLQHQQLGVSDGMAKAISLGGLWNGALGTIIENLKLTDPQMKLLIDDFIETGNTAQATAAIMEQTFGEALKLLDPAINAKKLKDVDNEFKKMEGFKDFGKGFKNAMIDMGEDMNKTKKVSTEFGNDIKLMLDGIAGGFSSKDIHSGFKELTNDLEDLVKKSPDKKQLDPMVEYLKGLTGPEIMANLPNLAPALNELNAAFNQPKGMQDAAIQAVIAKYPDIFKQMGVTGHGAASGVGGLTSSVAALGDESKTAAEKYQALNDAISKSKDLAVVLPQYKGNQPIVGRDDRQQKGTTGEIVEGKKDGKGTDDFGLKAMQEADKMAIKFNQDMNKYVIAGINAVGNKSSELLKIMGGNFDKLEASVNQSQVSVNKVMNTYMIAGMNLTGNKSKELADKMGKNFDVLESSTVSSMQSMNKVMNSYLIAGMNLTGNKSAQLNQVMSKEFETLDKNIKQSTNNIKASIDKMTGAMQLAESQAKSLVNQLGKIKDVKATVTTEFKITGSAKAQAAAGMKGGVHINAAGGMYYANQATSAIYGEAGPELALFLPIRQTGEPTRGDFDITVPTPIVDVSGINKAVNNMASPRNSKDLIGDRGMAHKAITIVLNTADKVMMNERELIEIIRQKVFKHIVQEMG